MPQKLDDCVAKVKAKGEVDNPWAFCNASIGKETKEHHNPLDIPFGHEVDTKETKAEITESIIKDKSGSRVFRKGWPPNPLYS